MNTFLLKLNENFLQKTVHVLAVALLMNTIFLLPLHGDEVKSGLDAMVNFSLTILPAGGETPPPESRPDKPQNNLPGNGSRIPLPYAFAGSAFRDPLNFAHLKTIWSFRRGDGNYNPPLLQTESLSTGGTSLTNFQLQPAEIFQPNQVYFWKMQYVNFRNVASEFSDEQSFTIDAPQAASTMNAPGSAGGGGGGGSYGGSGISTYPQTVAPPAAVSPTPTPFLTQPPIQNTPQPVVPPQPVAEKTLPVRATLPVKEPVNTPQPTVAEIKKANAKVEAQVEAEAKLQAEKAKTAQIKLQDIKNGKIQVEAKVEAQVEAEAKAEAKKAKAAVVKLQDTKKANAKAEAKAEAKVEAKKAADAKLQETKKGNVEAAQNKKTNATQKTNLKEAQKKVLRDEAAKTPARKTAEVKRLGLLSSPVIGVIVLWNEPILALLLAGASGALAFVRKSRRSSTD